jgi:large repetitive protein
MARDAVSQAPLEGVSLTVAGREGQSGGEGHFEIDSIPAGTHQVTAEAAGYVGRTLDAEIRPGIENLYDVELTATEPAGLTITTSSLPPGTVDLPYEVSLDATGGTPPYQWAGHQPAPGLAVTPDGRVSGTPGFPVGSYSVVVSVRDADSPWISATLTLEIRTTSGLRAVGEQLSSGEVGVPYADTLSGEGGAAPLTFELDRFLPGGLQLDPATGIVSGTPLAGTGPEGEPIEFELTVRDAVGATAFAPISLGILPPSSVIASDLPDGQVDVSYEAWLDHSGGFGTYDEYTVISGSLPPGLSILGPMSLFGSRLVGTPTLAGTYRFTLQLALCPSSPDDCTPQIATREYEVVIAGSPISIVTSSLPDADVGTPYSVFLVREGGTGPVQWDVVSGTLPAGISLTTAGELTGTPTAPGEASFEVRVRDSGDQSATATLTLEVQP